MLLYRWTVPIPEDTEEPGWDLYLSGNTSKCIMGAYAWKVNPAMVVSSSSKSLSTRSKKREIIILALSEEVFAGQSPETTSNHPNRKLQGQIFSIYYPE
jgi:hypothetical protein